MNKKIVQKIYTAFKDKDHKTIIDLQSEDVEWSVAASPDKVPWAGRSRGHKGVMHFLKTIGDYLVPEAFGIQHFAETGNMVIAIGYQAGYIKRTGDHYEYDFVHVWEVNNGKVSRLRVYFDSAYVALSVAGEQKTAV
jgi:ketosteroid isomerase-like protein